MHLDNISSLVVAFLFLSKQAKMSKNIDLSGSNHKIRYVMSSDDKYKEYSERHKEWSNMAVNQLSVTNNLLFTLASGFFVFCVEQKKYKNLHFGLSNFSAEYTFYMLAITCIVISIFCGTIVIFTRLYDFRISRHIALARKRESKENKCSSLCNILFGTLIFVKDEEVRTEKVKKLNVLRRLAHILGELSWVWTKLQTMFLLLSVILYFIYMFSCK
jgi:hypothetical protein